MAAQLRFGTAALIPFTLAALASGCGGSSTSGQDAGTGGDAAALDGSNAASGDGSGAGDAGMDGSALDATGPDGATEMDALAQPDAVFIPAAHPAFPQLPQGTNGVLTTPTIVTIVASNDTLAMDLFTFSDQLIAGTWWPAVATEYGIGRPAHSVHLTGPAITANISGSQMERYIRQAITGHANMQPNGSMIYMLYLPDGINAVEDNTGMPNNGCQFYGGYHQQLGNDSDNWAYGQRCDMHGSARDQLDTLTVTGSHEIIESATDPVDGFYLPITSTSAPWLDSVWSQYYGGVVEAGDLCGSTGIRIGTYEYQRSWSNRAAAEGGDPCVPTINEPYFAASAPQDWYAMAPGQTINVTITGWATAPMPDYAIVANIDTGYDGFNVTLTSSTSTLSMSGNIIPLTNNGRTSRLTVTAPAHAERDVYYVILELDTYTLGPSSDYMHFWPVGFYVH
jgi:hypothetical protein